MATVYLRDINQLIIVLDLYIKITIAGSFFHNLKCIYLIIILMMVGWCYIIIFAV